MAPRDLPVVGGGGASGWVATSVWGSCGPLPTLATMTLPGVIGWRSPTPRTLSVRWGWNFLKRGPPTPTPSCSCFANAGGAQDPWPILTPRGVEKELKILCDDFFVAATPRLHHLVPPHLTIPCLHKPPKHNVAVPINKFEGRLGGANPVGGGVRASRHPKRGVRKGFGAEGGFT